MSRPPTSTLRRVLALVLLVAQCAGMLHLALAPHTVRDGRVVDVVEGADCEHEAHDGTSWCADALHGPGNAPESCEAVQGPRVQVGSALQVVARVEHHVVERARPPTAPPPSSRRRWLESPKNSPPRS